MPVIAEADGFRHRLQQIVTPDVDEGPPPPQLTDRARRLLLTAKQLLDRQWTFAADPLFAALAAEGTDPLAPYHQETVAVLDSAVRLAQTLPDSPSAQLKQCTGLDGLLGVVQERLAVQERALARRKTDADRIDRLASVYTAMAANAPVGLTAVATLAEELLDDARQARPLRFVSRGGRFHDRVSRRPSAFPAPIRFIAAHAINVAQVVARLVPFDPEWAGHPLLAVVAALLIDCGMTTIPAEVLSRGRRANAQRAPNGRRPRAGRRGDDPSLFPRNRTAGGRGRRTPRTDRRHRLPGRTAGNDRSGTRPLARRSPTCTPR